jgi:DNA-binding LacI/PurR family transcriptional regulator
MYNMVTIKHVALLSDINPSSVSNVLHGRPRNMREDVLERVQRTI